MTAKEKAEELLDRYETLGKDFTRGVSMREFAKQCALIAVDEIVEEVYNNESSISRYKYWDEVINQIENL
jgi:hypothetical protein